MPDVRSGDRLTVEELLRLLHPRPAARKRIPGQAKAQRENMERIIRALCAATHLPQPLTEHRFHPRRLWKMDYAWPAQRLFLEVEGGVWINGAHTRASGFVRNLEKYNTAAAMGWRLIRCQPRDLIGKRGQPPAVLALLLECLSDATPKT